MANAPDTAGHAAADGDAKLAENVDAAPAAIEGVRADVEMKSVLHFSARPAAERLRLFKQTDALAPARNERRGGQPRPAAADDDGIVG
jgi:hypothetical protein